MKNLLKYIDLTGIGLAIIMTISMATMVTKPAGANDMYQLDVTYTNGSVLFGPLSFGLSTLPTSVTATFTLGPGLPGTLPEDQDNLYFSDEDLATASVSFGDATWTVGSIVGFDMVSTPTGIDSLTYLFSPISTDTATNIIIMNFPLRILGTDIESNMPFEYQYADSTQTLTAIQVTAAIDIKPGSDPNCFNINGHGVIPVAIFGSEGFDASLVDPETLLFGGLEVRMRGNKGPLCSIEYSNDDTYQDLVCHFEDDSNNWDAGTGEATLTGQLLDGTSFEGTDSICVVPEP